MFFIFLFCHKQSNKDKEKKIVKKGENIIIIIQYCLIYM